MFPLWRLSCPVDPHILKPSWLPTFYHLQYIWFAGQAYVFQAGFFFPPVFLIFSCLFIQLYIKPQIDPPLACNWQGTLVHQGLFSLFPVGHTFSSPFLPLLLPSRIFWCEDVYYSQSFSLGLSVILPPKVFPFKVLLQSFHLDFFVCGNHLSWIYG